MLLLSACKQVSGVCCFEIKLRHVRLTCSQPLIMQQQRCPQGFGLIMVAICSLACRSRKNFLLRSVFFLHAKHHLRQTEGLFNWNKLRSRANEKFHNVRPKILHSHAPFRVEIHQPGHIVTDTSFQYSAAFIRLPKRRAGRKKVNNFMSSKKARHVDILKY